ncbi:ACT domain-containing protein [Sphingomonas sp.]|uniref:ACT domain-containing protein n=1 Tax=Sphingomonas sp. TaxID=28214 RepID=UPI00286A48E0|nr:ACT domain-containing protein [Sphingomonas sp.]
MAGERDLTRLLADLRPQLGAARYAFERVERLSLGEGDFALIREDGGVTAIRERADGAWARISLGVHSSLEAIGLTAVLSRRLADAGISANVVAALDHDHFFVPWDQRAIALEAISGVGAAGAT